MFSCTRQGPTDAVYRHSVNKALRIFQVDASLLTTNFRDAPWYTQGQCELGLTMIKFALSEMYHPKSNTNIKL